MGADANAVDDRLWTPLHCALANGHLEATKALLVDGTGSVNVNHANESGSSPLHYLARYTSCSRLVCSLSSWAPTWDPFSPCAGTQR